MAQSVAERKFWYRLRHETPFYARHVLKVVDERAELVPLRYRKAQLKLDRALNEQRKAGRPMRAIVLKSRKVGISTSVQAKLFHRATLMPNRRALVVAQDMGTAGELFDMADTMYSNLPPDAPELRPDLVSKRNSQNVKFMHFGERSRALRDRGEYGINSTLRIDTAREVNAGRGKTITDLHASEVAFWPDPKKALSLLNAVPDQPETVIVIESTANGHNFFKARWDRAVNGLGGYAAVFIGWTEDENCWRAFRDPDERERFIESIGTGVFGEAEPRLIEKFGCTPEQLHWRRTTIVDKTEGNLALFAQEFPSTPLEAFVGSGKHVFSIVFMEQAEDEARQFDPPREIPGADVQPGDGLLVAKGFKQRQLLTGTHEVPTGALWVPQTATDLGSKKDYWRVWQHPQPDHRYVMGVDVAAGEEQTSAGESDYSAIQIIDHHSLEQVAQWRSRQDRDLVTAEAFMAGLYFNEALIAVEVTGGLGLTVVEQLWKRYGYRRLYRRIKQGSMRDKQQTLLGWDTTRQTKPAMEDSMTELLREGTHGIRSLQLIAEMKTYVRFDTGQRGADDDAFDDLLMAYMIAQRVAQLVPPKITRPERRQHWNSMMRVTGGY